MNFNFFGIVERDHLTQIYFLNFPLQKKKKKATQIQNKKPYTYKQTNKQNHKVSQKPCGKIDSIILRLILVKDFCVCACVCICMRVYIYVCV